MLVPVPGAWREKLREAREPVQARDAATIAVIRNGEAGIETFLMRRQSSMAFAPGAYVFPGGGVDQADTQPLPWVGPEAGYFAERFNCSPETAHALVVAAARETFEETGVLLAGRDEDSVVADTTPYHDVRAALENHETSFAAFLREHELSLRADLLGAWSHWITPAFEPRRFDTRFFVAVLPEGQRIDSVGSEADSSAWLRPTEILRMEAQGSAVMLPPTRVTCGDLANETVHSVLESAQARAIRPIEPKLVDVEGTLWLETGGEDEV